MSCVKPAIGPDAFCCVQLWSSGMVPSLMTPLKPWCLLWRLAVHPGTISGGPSLVHLLRSCVASKRWQRAYFAVGHSGPVEPMPSQRCFIVCGSVVALPLRSRPCCRHKRSPRATSEQPPAPTGPSLPAVSRAKVKTTETGLVTLLAATLGNLGCARGTEGRHIPQPFPRHLRARNAAGRHGRRQAS